MKSKLFTDGSVIEVTEKYLVIVSKGTNVRYFAIPLSIIYNSSIIKEINKFDNIRTAIEFMNSTLKLSRKTSPAFNDSITNAEELNEARFYMINGYFRVGEYYYPNNDNIPYHLQTINIPRHRNGKLMHCYDAVTKRQRLCRV